jgi:hypothetical protein
MSNVEKMPITAGGPVRAIVPQDIDQAFRMATAIIQSGLNPPQLDTPQKVMVCIMCGLEVGLTPMQALQKIAVINNRPTIWGDGALGLVRGSGLCEYVKERIDGQGDKMVAVCEAKRRGEPEPIIRKFSVDDAKLAKLWAKAGPWQQFPTRMLSMRARAFALRDGFADVLGGLYLAEELQGTEPMRDITPPSPPSAPALPNSEFRAATEAPEPPQNGRLKEQLERSIDASKLMDDWEGRIRASGISDCEELFEGEIDPAFERGEISENQREHLVQIVMAKPP